MERKFYHENFEGSLKHDADQFKMYPSKKVWHGIYNDVHPGRRWPSVAISILFIFTLVIVGHLNTANPPGSISRIKPIQTLAVNKNVNRAAAKNINQAGQLNHRKLFPSNNPLSTIEIQDTPVGEATADIASQNTLPSSSTGIMMQAPTNADNGKYDQQPPQQLINITETQKQDIADRSTSNNKPGTNELPSLKIANDVKDGLVSDLILPATKTTAKTSAPEPGEVKKITDEGSQLIARQNRARKNKISMTFFMGPSLSYRTYSKNGKPASLTSSIDPLAANSTNENAIERPSLGFKGGVSVNYNMTRKLKFIGGLQLGYSEFNKKASNIHPTIASLVLINSATGVPYTLTSFSHYGSRTGGPAELNLHNYSFAASTPVGFQYTVGGTDDLKLDVVTTFQPTYVIVSQAYLLSSNNKYFISEPSLSRKWNMGISIGSLLSFGSGSYKWQVGPSIDYQLLSTYDSRYPVKEHLINYGVRMGVTKLKK